MRPRTAAAVVGLCVAVCTLDPALRAQVAPFESFDVPVSVDAHVAVASGGIVFSTVVEVPDASWLRLRFDQADLGAAPAGGRPTVLRLSSLADAATQTLDATGLLQWGNTSAYFNGDAVLVELIADEGAGPSGLTMTQVTAGVPGGYGTISLCGADDRVPSADPRVARTVPGGCTAWLISDAANCFLTAGHCAGSTSVVEFNVPLSLGDGTLVHPGPEDQYPVDSTSLQAVNGGVGNDWAYFGAFSNTETGLTAFEAQGDAFDLADTPPPVSGQTIRVTGHGTDTSPLEWNQIQQTHSGPYTSFGGSTIQYQVDTLGGNSGSPVIDETGGGLAIGIHTHGGCNSVGGSNSGTAISRAGLQAAMASPLGVCVPMPSIEFAYPNGLPLALDPQGAAIRVEVQPGAGGGAPQPGTGLLHYDLGSGFVTAAMDEVSANVYDAVFPVLDCGEPVRYYVSAETTTGTVMVDPFMAPLDAYNGVAAVTLTEVFSDDFQQPAAGWAVSGNANDGQWEVGYPIGGGDLGDPPTDGDGSGRCFLTDNADGASDVDSGSTVLTSPILDATQATAVLAYWRWFSNSIGGPADDALSIEVSDDGGSSWSILETVGPGGDEADGGWFERYHRIADVASQTDEFRMRVTAVDFFNASNVEAGLDGVRLLAADCQPIDACPWDCDGSDDGVVGIDDFLAVLAQWGMAATSCDMSLGPAGTGIDEFLAVLANWGPCPQEAGPLRRPGTETVRRSVTE